MNTIADELHVPQLSRHIPYAALYIAGRTAELLWQAMGRRNAAPPPVTTYGVTLLGGDQQFSIEKARRELGYAPKFDMIRGVVEGVNWYLQAKKGNQETQTEPEVVSHLLK